VTEVYAISTLLDEVLQVLQAHTKRDILGVTVETGGDSVTVGLDPGFNGDDNEDEDEAPGLSETIKSQISELFK